MASEVRVERSPVISEHALAELRRKAWPDSGDGAFSREHALAYFGAFSAEKLVGFVRLAWDGGTHAFILDPVVHPAYRRRGLGRELISHAVEAASEAGCSWLHVDFSPELQPFYEACGFQDTSAGVMQL